MARPNSTRRAPPWSFALVMFVGVFAALFAPVLAGDATVVHGDALSVSLPLQHVLAEALAEGRLPLWSDEIYGGHPLFAEGQGGFAHPLNLLLFGAFPALGLFDAGEPGLVAPATIYAHGLLHVVCGIVAALGTYALCRSYRLGVVASTFAGLALACSQDWLWQSSNSAIAGASAWAPWTLAAVERWWRRPGVGTAVALAAAIAAMALAGYPQAVHGVALFALVSVGARLDRAWLASPWRHVATGLLAVALGVGLAAVQLLPTLELVGESVRAGGVAVVSSATPVQQLRGVLYSIGQRAAIDPGLGSVLVVALAGVALRASRAVLGLALASALLFLLSAADASPVYRALHHVLPGLDGFRITHLYATIGSIGVAVLAAMGVERLASVEHARALGRGVAVACTAVAVVVAVACALLHDALVPAATYAFPLAAVGAVAALWWTRRSHLVRVALLAVLLAEIAVLRLPLHRFVDVRVVRTPPPIVREILDRDPGDRWFRVANVPHFFAYVGFASASAKDLDRLAGLFLSSMDAGSNQLWSIPSINANLALPLARRLAVEPLIEAEIRGESPRLPGTRFVDGEGVRYVAVHNQHRDKSPFADDLEQTYYDPDYRFHLLANAHAEPRLRFVAGSDAAPVSDAADAARALAEKGARLYVEADASAFPNDRGDPVRPAATFVTGLAGAERNVAVLDVVVPGFLVVADAMYPGWHARVNGEAAPLYAANALEKAVPLEAGRYHVEIAFEPASFRVGAVVSAVSVAVALSLLVLGRARPRARDAA